MKKIIKYFLYFLLSLVIAFALFLAWARINDYQPEETNEIYSSKNPTVLNDTLRVSLMIWNIGYAGLSQEMDFFYDGGENTRPTKEIAKNNIRKIRSFLEKADTLDFILLQEVDRDSKRSYYMDEFDSIKKTLPDYKTFFGKNYDVKFVPLPPASPMGKVTSGLMTLSRYDPKSVVRHSFPGNYSFPTGLFMLDRCFLVNRHPLKLGKELLIINTHNSAYDDGTLRKAQMEFMKKFLTAEYKKGNYVIVGGDWNQSPAGFEPDFEKNVFDTVNLSYIPENYPAKDWKWLYENNVPTNRRVAIPYKAGKSPTTVIDFFLISPNIKAMDVKTINMDFQYSDHQPVWTTLQLTINN